MWIPREPDVLGQPTQAEVGQHFVGHQRHTADVVPRHAWHGIQVDAQLVGVVQVIGARRMGVEVDAAQVDDPGQLRGIPQDDLVGCAP